MRSTSPSTSKKARPSPSTSGDWPWIAPSLRHLAVPVDTLQCDPANLRLHGERSLEGIKASLRRFGQRKPIVVDAGGITIAGAGVLIVAKALGWSHIAVTKHDDLTGAERVAYAIADNRTAELSEWDKDALKSTLGAASPDELASMGYSADELSQLVHPDDETQQDEIPEPLPDPVSQRGDLWLLGEQRLLCGDCTDTADVRRVMAGELARLVATDPPYLVGYDGTNRLKTGNKRSGKDWSKTYGQAWNESDPENPLYSRFIAAATAIAAHADAAWYVWYSSNRHTLLERAFFESDLLAHCQIVWVKSRHTATRTWYFMQHEPCLVAYKKGHMPEDIEDGQPILYGFETCLMGWKKGNKPKPIEGQPLLSSV